MIDAATGLPAAPAPFVETGTDALSAAISAKLPGIEDPIQEALPKLKAEATKTANNIVTAAGQYQSTDEQLAAKYAAHQFDSAGSAGAGSAGSGGAAGGGDAMSSMSQMMSMPMQMASQAAQLPSQALGALASAPQSVMQGVQQVSQMAGGGASGVSGAAGSTDAAGASDASGSSGDSGPTGPSGPSGPEQPKDDKAEKDKHDPQQGAAAGESKGERVPGVRPPAEVVAPQQNPGRHVASDPAIDV